MSSDRTTLDRIVNWVRNWFVGRQCDSEIPVSKKIVAICVRSKGHFGSHKSWSGDIW